MNWLKRKLNIKNVVYLKRISDLEKQNYQLIGALRWNKKCLMESENLKEQSLSNFDNECCDKEYILLLDAWHKIANSIKWNNRILNDLYL